MEVRQEVPGGSIRRSDNSAGNRIRVRPIELLACSRQGRCPCRQQGPEVGRRSPPGKLAASFVPGSPLGQKGGSPPALFARLESAPARESFTAGRRARATPGAPGPQSLPAPEYSARDQPAPNRSKDPRRRNVTPDPSATLVTGVGPRSTRRRRRSRWRGLPPRAFPLCSRCRRGQNLAPWH